METAMAAASNPLHNSEHAPMEFHVSRRARERYQFDESLFSLHGNVIFANFHAARLFAQKINQKRDLASSPEQTARAGHINTMGLIDEIMHFVVGLYRKQQNPQLMALALSWLEERLGKAAVDSTLARFVDEFPPLEVYRRGLSPEGYLAASTTGVSNRVIVLEEMIMLWVGNMNPALAPYVELFDDSPLERDSAYLQVIFNLHRFFDTQPRFGPGNENVMDMLRSPAIAIPYSLSGQLEYIREKWGYLLGSYLYRLLSSLDLIREEEKVSFAGPGPALTLEMAGLEAEPERYSTDLFWMPRLVMMAKSTYVWLDQLSRRYQRSITRLDQIPDEELDNLARWGFSGLWLIGLWERSRASETIKRLMGNPEAVASAYSLFDYTIAADLGGEEAFAALKERAWRRGLRLASDMVPNHMGMDSTWVMDHPDWFVSLDYSPFPSYSFNGQNLSWRDGTGIFLEDHYYSRSDAAVVFKRVDYGTGSEKYIYHGNDGTSMPWNDTAQLNLLKPEVREAVIQTILSVARKFPIIRFDAAMTLAKKHYQRLWFPEPGTGGAIPSRSDHGLTRAQFDEAMPAEFWREVVDRVAQEAPDTLLLAEAFWLMEGYFVRTLGMHRVYNSAFMNMLKAEDNAKFRTSIKNVLEFDPEILKRFVNFMNNPDEDTAVAQFGVDDKYFGVCTMMITMPGLPMFGHGQIEGFTEKYGMEYRRAYKDEQPNWGLIERHEREIFPLMRRRHIFAEMQNFLLYDVFAPEGYVNENIFAYSNRADDERGLVIYNNKFEDAHGWVRTSVAFLQKTGAGEERALVQKSLGEGLGLRNDSAFYCVFRDHLTGLEYIRNSKDLWERGLFVQLGAFKCQVFLDVREVEDAGGHYSRLAAQLDGRGVASIDEALQEIYLQPVQQPFKDLLQVTLLHRLATPGAQPEAVDLNEATERMQQMLSAAQAFSGTGADVEPLAQAAQRTLLALVKLPTAAAPDGKAEAGSKHAAYEYIARGFQTDPVARCALFAWWATSSMGPAMLSRAWLDEWRLAPLMAGALHDAGLGEAETAQAVLLVKALLANPDWLPSGVTKARRAGQALRALLADDDARRALQVNRFNNVLWYNKEAFDQLQLGLLAALSAQASAADDMTPAERQDCLTAAYEVITRFQTAEAASAYQVDKLLAAV